MSRTAVCGVLLAVITATLVPGADSSRSLPPSKSKFGGEVVAKIMGPDSLMAPRQHGTCVATPQANLKWGCNLDVADQIGCFNRHYAEHSGYFLHTTFLSTVTADLPAGGEITFYDSVTGKPLFVAPRGRTFADFVAESKAHGWPSFRDEEVVATNVRLLANGETVSVDGTHLGHNLPDSKGNRYCINLVCIAGHPAIGDPDL